VLLSDINNDTHKNKNSAMFLLLASVFFNDHTMILNKDKNNLLLKLSTSSFMALPMILKFLFLKHYS
jgi:hypothetical protein